VTQNQIVLEDVPPFLGPHWGYVEPFAARDPVAPGLYHDPGLPHQFGTPEFLEEALLVIDYSSKLDPTADDDVMIDIGPGSMGNTPVDHSESSITLPYFS
jgi:hypothetical protein